MQWLWYYLLRTYIWLGLHFYFKKIVIHGRTSIPPGPVIFAANHQNAFMDALMIVCFNSHFTYFLTRADIFKKPFIRWLLSTLNMMPIYRIRDGWQALSENQKTFEACDDLFQKNGAVVIFPEGNHGGQRRLRPLSKGFTRLAFESLQKHPDMKISVVPVGLNYSSHQAFRSSVSVHFGAAILANEYFKDPVQGANQLRNDLSSQLKMLITHVDSVDHYAETIQKLELTHPDYLNPVETNEKIYKIARGEALSINPTPKKNAIWLAPLHYFALLINFVPLIIWQKINRGIKDPVFVSSLKFGVGIFMFPAFYLVAGLAIGMLFGSFIAFCWWIVSFPSMLFKNN